MIAADLIAELLFGAIGMAAFVYGKKQGRLKTTLISVVIMGYPYFVTDTLLLYGIGIVLTAALFVFRD